MGASLAESLHRAIQDAIRDARAYEDRGILVMPFLEATHRLSADDTILYRSVYTIFRALPVRLMEGSALNVSTCDVEGGVELVWEGRERLHAGEGRESDLRTLLGSGPHGDLLEIALVALEQFCNMRAGFVEVKREAVEASTSFERPAYVTRRVLARIPMEGLPPPGFEARSTVGDAPRSGEPGRPASQPMLEPEDPAREERRNASWIASA